MAKGVGLRLLSRRGSWVQIPPSAPMSFCLFLRLLSVCFLLVGMVLLFYLNVILKLVLHFLKKVILMDERKMGNKKYLAIIISAILIISAFVGGYYASQTGANNTNDRTTVTVQDSADRLVEVPYPVKTIVTLWDNPTEILAALGATDRIVGVDQASKGDIDTGLYPELANIPVIGSDSDPNYEKIAELKPDVVIMLSSYSPLPDEVAEQLEPFGIAVVALDFYRTEVYYREVQTLGYMLDLEAEAASLNTFFKEVQDMITERIGTLSDSEKKSVYFEGSSKYKTFGGAGYGAGCPGMIRAAGGIDLYPEVSTVVFEVDPEDVAKRNPDIICTGTTEGYLLTNTTKFETLYNSVLDRDELAGTKAVKNGDVYVISWEIAGGARKPFGTMYLAKIMYPDLFADFDPNQVIKEYLENYLHVPYQGVFIYPAI